VNPTDLLGTTLDGRFELVDFLGQGAFGWVYQATDTTTGEAVAIKLLAPGSLTPQLAELENEGRLLKKLSHGRNVIDLLGEPLNSASLPAMLPSGAATQVPLHFLVLELMDGSLAQLLGFRAQFTWIERLGLFRNIVCGAHQMHQNSIYHRDIKSENILLRAQGKSAEAKVSDLGRSKDLGESAPSHFPYELGRGDFRFAPPEFLWALGTATSTCFGSADVYMLGAILFEIATGQTLTSLVFPNPIAWIQRAQTMRPHDREADFQARISEIRYRYEVPLELFEDELPASLKNEAAALLRQLCDPDPTMRTRRTRLEQHLPVADLQWLIRRVDILTRRLGIAEKRTARYGKTRKAVN
jgi:eukaryotic-like serine/threonine-protein kinase